MMGGIHLTKEMEGPIHSQMMARNGTILIMTDMGIIHYPHQKAMHAQIHTALVLKTGLVAQMAMVTDIQTKEIVSLQTLNNGLILIPTVVVTITTTMYNNSLNCMLIKEAMRSLQTLSLIHI